jgi:spoIIIJ-associated protein
MEWVETTGSTVEEAKEAALDELGVDEADAEFEVISEARAGLFGRLRSEARVRARVRPTAPRAKEDRRDRRRRTSAGKDTGPASTVPASNVMVEAANPGSAGTISTNGGAAPVADNVAEDSTSAPSGQETGGAAAGTSNRRRRSRGPGNRERDRQSGSEQGGSQPARDKDRTDNGEREGAADVEVDLEEQGKIAAEFLTQLTAEFGLQASVATTKVDDDTLEIQMTGSDLGLLIGPKGATLTAIQNLARTVVHYETGANNGHINIDVGGYRHKRTEALIRFADQVAAQVKQSGTRTALEPMSAVDRKVVHDAISAIEGVSTVSEGEEPRRRVVVVPSDVNS